MIKNMDIVNAQLYVTTEHSYQSGNMFGEWMILSDYTSLKEFYIGFEQLYSKEQNPNMKLLAWKNVPRCLLIDKQKVSSKIFKIIRIMSSFCESDRKAFYVWLELNPEYISMYTSNELVSYFKFMYVGAFPSKEFFGYKYAFHNLGISDLGFGYEEFTKQLFEDRFIYENEFVFRK